MKVPIDWLKDYIQIEKPPEEIAEAFTAIGLMLDSPINNSVLDLEHRMDRSDWLSIIGCARDLAAYENLDLKLPARHTQSGGEGGQVYIKIECPEIVKRFNTKVFRGLKVNDSPDWLKERLRLYGIPSINNIVDITNFVMVEYGQPMHAQDLAKFEEQEIVIRMAKEGETLVTLDGTEVKLDPEIFILTQNGKPSAIGGIVGGVETGVTDTTTDIVLDAGTYDHAYIRKASRKLKIQNETVQRYNKFLHPDLTEVALERAVQLILELAGGEYFENYDYYPNKMPPVEMNLRYSRIEKIGGTMFEPQRVKEIIGRLGYQVMEESGEGLKLQVPYFRTDVVVEDDIVSDILRIDGYSKIPVRLIDSAPPQEITSDIYKFEDELRDVLTRLVLHEHITDPLVSANLEGAGQILLENSLNSEKIAMRMSIYETLLPVAKDYKKHGIGTANIFELGKIYEKTGPGDKLEDYKETRVAEIICAEGNSPKETNDTLKKIVSGMLKNLGIDNVIYTPGDNCAQVFQADRLLGKVGLDFAEFYTEALLAADKGILRVEDRLTNYALEDITLEIDMDNPAGPIAYELGHFNPVIKEVAFIDGFVDRESNKRALTFRLSFSQTDQNGQNYDVKKVKEELIGHLVKDFGITVKS